VGEVILREGCYENIRLRTHVMSTDTDLDRVFKMISGVSSLAGWKLCLPVGLGHRYLPGLLVCHDEYPKGLYGCSSTAPSAREVLSYRQSQLSEHTWKILRNLSRFRPQAAISSLSLLAWRAREIGFRLPRTAILLWISATVLRLRH
jgi:hypothetical protein